MNKKKSEAKKIENLIKLYDKYRVFRTASGAARKDKLPPLTLDEQLENINPYYTKNQIVKYG